MEAYFRVVLWKILSAQEHSFEQNNEIVHQNYVRIVTSFLIDYDIIELT